MELFFIQARPDGVIPSVADLTDQDSYTYISSLKWATYYDPRCRLVDLGIGLRPQPISSTEITAGAREGLLEIYTDLALRFPMFRDVLFVCPETPEKVIDSFWEAHWIDYQHTDEIVKFFDEPEVPGDSGRSAWALLYSQMIKHARTGKWACWSY